MLTMPCDVGRLIRRRLGPHGDAAVATAGARWAQPGPLVAGLDPEQPRDARVFLGDWPVRALLDAPDAPPESALSALGEPLPPPTAPVLRALGALWSIDPVAAILIVEGARGAFDPGLYRAALGEGEAAVLDRVAIALFRHAVLELAADEALPDPVERASLRARFLRAGDASEIAALRAARADLADPSLSLTALRAAAQRGCERALALLSADARWGVVLAGAARTAMARALRLEEWDMLDVEPTFYVAPFSLLAREVAGAQPRGEAAHHARPADAPRWVEHLLVCEDLRCVRRARGDACGRLAAFRQLAGPLSEPPPPSQFGPRTPHMIRCRDVLWETFTSMASAEGRGVDDLVEEAMDRYRALRKSVPEASPSGDAIETESEEEITRPR